MSATAQSLTLSHNIGDLLAKPEFQGFAERLLPWDDVPTHLPLNRLADLMPYHSHIQPAEIVATLNKMAQAREKGEQIFYDIYLEAEKQQDLDKRHTSIFFFKGKPNAPFA